MTAYKSEPKSVPDPFAAEALKPEEQIDLGRAALLIAKIEYPSLQIDTYLERLDQYAQAIDKKLVSRDADEIVDRINELLYDELSYRGNAENYYDPKNSFLNEVMERCTGIPITLSVIYIEVARRLGVPIEGVGMPGHFLVRCPALGDNGLIDPFHRGRRVSQAECEQLVASVYGQNAQLLPEHLRAVTKREILTRMLINLKNIYMSGGDAARALSMVDRILLLNPTSLNDLRDRGIIYFLLGRFSPALNDLERYLERAEEGPEAEGVRQYIARIKARMASLN